MKRILLTAILSSSMTTSFAAPVWHPSGPNLTLGDISHGRSILSDVTNPASGAVILKSGENQYRFGILSSIGFGAEYGDIDNLFETVDAELDKIQSTTIDPLLADTDISNAVTSLNNVLADIEENGYANVHLTGHVPVMPIVIAHSALGGALALDINYAATARLATLHEDIRYTSLLDPNDHIDYDPLVSLNTFSVNNDTSILVSGAAVVEGSLGYSRNVLTNNAGDLYAGLKAKYLRVGLIHVAQRLADPNLQNSETTFDNVDDNDYTDSTAIGFDLGMLWVSNNYRLGATFTNVNEPEFEYNQIDFNAAGYTQGSSVYQRLSDLGKYTMETQAKLEGALFTESLNWVIGASLDANAVKGPFGDEYQWANISAGFTPNSWLIPGFRLGYRTNLAGTELSMAEAGVTFFKVVNIDLAYGLDTVKVDGDDTPRSLYANIGFELTF